jgi:hypothetical protein
MADSAMCGAEQVFGKTNGQRVRGTCAQGW